MNKVITISLAVLAIAGVFAFGFYITGNKDNTPSSASSREDESSTTTNTEEVVQDTEAGETSMVTLRTNMGDIVLELYTEKMPITAGNFLKLAKDGFYDGVKFHRVISGFMIQGGDPNTKGGDVSTYGAGGPGYTIEDEFVEGFSNVRGTISMANAGPDTGGSQFFINLVDNTNLDFDKEPLSSKHPVFGRVVEGMDVVDAIGDVETGPRDLPTEDVVIESVVVSK